MSYEFGSSRPQLDARLNGSLGVLTSPAGTNTDHFFTFPYDATFNGIEIIPDTNSVAFGDCISLETQYQVGPTTWKRYKKFGKRWGISPTEKTVIMLFPTYPSTGVRIRLTYHSIGAVPAKVYINLFTFVEQAAVKASLGEEGEDW